MASIDIFKGDAFDMVAMTAAIEKVPYVPGTLGSMGIFGTETVNTEDFMIEQREGQINLIPTTPLHAPATRQDIEKRSLRKFPTVRLAQNDLIRAAEIAGVRAFGNTSEMQSMQVEVARRQAKMRTNLELTREYHRLGAIQGLVLDADGTSVLYDWYDEFNITKPADYSFGLADPDADLRDRTKKLAREMIQSSKGAIMPGMKIHALCASDFYDDYVKHPSVEKFYTGFVQGRSLRNQEGSAFETFEHGGMTFHDYRGTDDNSTIKIPDGTCRVFAAGPNAFAEIIAPANDKLNWVNTPGQREYTWIDIDPSSAPSYVDVNLNSYGACVCKLPETLRAGVA